MGQEPKAREFVWAVAFCIQRHRGLGEEALTNTGKIKGYDEAEETHEQETEDSAHYFRTSPFKRSCGDAVALD